MKSMPCFIWSSCGTVWVGVSTINLSKRWCCPHTHVLCSLRPTDLAYLWTGTRTYHNTTVTRIRHRCVRSVPDFVRFIGWPIWLRSDTVVSVFFITFSKIWLRSDKCFRSLSDCVRSPELVYTHARMLVCEPNWREAKPRAVALQNCPDDDLNKATKFKSARGVGRILQETQPPWNRKAMTAVWKKAQNT